MMSAVSYSYVALLDVLGYKERLNADRKSGVLHFRDALIRFLEIFNGVNEADFSHEAISDTIILRCQQRDKIIEFLELVRKVQISFLHQGLFTRGGVVYQQHFQSGKVTYSLALSQAYELEQKKAIYPRVVVDKNIVDMFNSEDADAPVFHRIIGSDLIIEWNGIYFVNLLTPENWSEVKASAEKIYYKDKLQIMENEGVFAKHVWFENLLFVSPFVDDSASRYVSQPRSLLSLFST